MSEHKAQIPATGQKYESPYSDCLAGTINNATNDDFCGQRDRLIELISDADLDTKKYRKSVEALQHTNDVIESMVSKT